MEIAIMNPVTNQAALTPLTEPTYSNSIYYRFNCGFFNHCEYFSNLSECVNKFKNNPHIECIENITSFVVEHVKVCMMGTETKCWQEPDFWYDLLRKDTPSSPRLYISKCTTSPKISCASEPTGKVFEGPEVTASRRSVFSDYSGSNSSLLPVIFGIGLLAFLYKTSKITVNFFRK